jgi:hypothetical protein
MFRRLLTPLALLVLSAPSIAQTIYVDANAKTGGDGKTWATAYNTVQAGLGAASSGARVWVAMGTYNGGFTVPAGVTATGGFHNGDFRETQRDVAGVKSILDGGAGQRVVRLMHNSKLDGFVVRNGTAAGGGGLRADNVTASICNCFFTNNKNTSGRGAAIYAEKATLNISNSAFYKNIGIGHVIEYETSGGTLDHVVVHDNVSNGFHFSSGSTPKIYNSVFSLNTGRGICHINANDAPIVENNLLWGNKVSLYHYRGTELRTIAAVNNLLYAKNNISADPKFVSPGNFRTMSSSPLIDKGQNMVGPTFAWRDYWDNSRILDSDLNGSMVTDIGTYEANNARVHIAGIPKPNAQINVRIDTSATVAGVMLLGVTPTRFLIDPYGYVFVSIPGAVILPWPVNANGFLTIPKTFQAGTALVWQGLVLNATGGNMTNLVDMRIK